ncbi:VOC family protein [Streptomyces uncialis]|uniref:VOC family protein n=1 Tax=Streptomyces uncialis TaxID=1048205 RepID=UPI0037F8CBF5
MTEARQEAGRRDGAEQVRRAPGTPCWVSLMAHGMTATQEFYQALFGWEFRPGPEQLGPYVRALLDGQEVAGIGQLPGGARLQVAWTPYLASDRVDRTADTVRVCGGTVAVGPLDAADAGRLAIASDPAGAVFGIWQGAAHLGAAVSGVPGAPVWNELITRDTRSVATFYRYVFGYTEERAPTAGGVDRLDLLLGGKPVATVTGVGTLPRDRGAHWLTSFGVTDIDASVGLVTRLGGRVVHPPAASDQGRAATVADPEGAVFALVELG